MKLHRHLKAGTAIACAFSMMAVAGNAQAALDAGKIGVVGAVNPMVSVKPVDGVTKTVKIDHTVQFEDTIITDANGSTQVIFADKSTVTVGTNSSLIIDKFVYDPATSKGEMTLSAVKGTLRFIGGALSKKEAVEIKTPSATIGIRGGITILEHNVATGGTDATFVYGEEMTLTGMNGETMSTTVPGSAISVPQIGAAPTPPVKVTMQQLSRKNNLLNITTPANGGAEEAPSDSKVNQILGESNESEESGETASANEGDADSQGNTQNASTEESDESGSSERAAESDAGQENTDGAELSGFNESSEGAETTVQIAEVDTMASDTADTAGVISDITNTTTETNRESTLEERNQQTTTSSTEDVIDDNENNNTPGDNGSNTEQTAEDIITENTTTEDPAENTTTEEPADNSGSTSSSGGENPDLPTSQPLTGDRLQVETAILRTPGLVRVTREVDSATGANAFHIELQNLSGDPLDSPSNAVILQPGSIGFSRLDDAAATDTEGNIYDISTTAIDINGANFDRGMAYVAPYKSMYAYYLRQDASTLRYNLVFGRQMSAAEKGGLRGIDYFDALPSVISSDVSGYNDKDYGFFVYSAANDGLLDNYGLDTTLNDLPNYGLLVDWDNKQFISASFNKNASQPFKLAFGSTDVENTTTMQGNIYRFDLNYNSDEVPKFGIMRVKADRMYGSSDGKVDGFIVGGVLSNNPAENTETNISNTAFMGERFRQPMVRDLAESNGPDTINRTTQDMKGFAAGIIRFDTAGSNTFKHYQSSDITQVNIHTDKANSTISADITMQDVSEVASDMRGEFGHAVESVFIADDGYAAAQSKHIYAPEGMPDARDGDEVNGFIVSGNAITGDSSLECTSCDFVHWGVWSTEIKHNEISSGTTDYMPAIPYVAGDPMQDFGNFADGIDGSVVYVDYDGKVFGVRDNGTAPVYETGTFSAIIDLNNRTVKEMDLMLPQGQYGFDPSVTSGAPIAAEGDATFNAHLYKHDGADYSSGGIIGTTNGAFFGSNAENIGGNYHIDDTDLMTGVYYGAR